MTDLLYPAVVVLAGYLVLGLTGFGSALVIVPLLSWRWPLPEVVALTLMLDVPAAAMQGGLNLRSVRFDELRRMLPGLVAGSVAGLWIADALEPKWPLFALGVYVAFVGLDALRTAPLERRPLAPGWSHAAGFVVGVVEMMFGTAGPVVVAWLQRRFHDVQALRATIAPVIMVAAAAVLVSMGAAGRLSNPDLWLRWAGLIGLALAGVLIGNRLAVKVPVITLRRGICLLLVASGLTLTRHVAG